VAAVGALFVLGLLFGLVVRVIKPVEPRGTTIELIRPTPPPEPPVTPPIERFNVLTVKPLTIPLPPIPDPKTITVLSEPLPPVGSVGDGLATTRPGLVGRGARPDYPEPERRLGHEGVTQVHVCVATDGRVDGTAMTRSSGWSVLDRTALAWLARQRFTPGTVGGSPVAGCYDQQIVWSLKD
jgi:protein TonB